MKLSNHELQDVMTKLLADNVFHMEAKCSLTDDASQRMSLCMSVAASAMAYAGVHAIAAYAAQSGNVLPLALAVEQIAAELVVRLHREIAEKQSSRKKQ